MRAWGAFAFNGSRMDNVQPVVRVTEANRVAADDEAALIGRARDGDRDAQDLLARRYLNDVYGLTLRMLRDPDLAADATQDTMVNALNGLRRFRGDASFRTWLLRIAANAAKSVARRRGRRREVTLDVVETMAADEPDTATIVSMRAEAERIARLVDHLPPKQRMAVTLRIQQGLSYAEIGVILRCTEVAARVNYHLGIKRLKESL